MLDAIKEKVKVIKRDLIALYLAYGHPKVPWYAKLFAALVLGYTLSPIDLIPDFIPVLGYLDDLVLLPLGISIAIKLIPKSVMDECREKSANIDKAALGNNKIAALVIIALWLLLLCYFVSRYI